MRMVIDLRHFIRFYNSYGNRVTEEYIMKSRLRLLLFCTFYVKLITFKNNGLFCEHKFSP